MCVFLYIHPHQVACEILVPQPGIELAPPALEAQSLNGWTTREVPESCVLNSRGMLRRWASLFTGASGDRAGCMPTLWALTVTHIALAVYCSFSLLITGSLEMLDELLSLGLVTHFKRRLS